MLPFNRRYFILTILLFIVEIFIALYVRDNFIRPYLGDVLVVILIYCFVKSFIKLPVLTVAISTLVFSFIVEFLQLINVIELLGLENSKIAQIVIGTSFSWFDLLAYLIGILLVILVEKYGCKKSLRTKPN
ncbi:MAG: DUF2809 domain-containing protein [Weeksellaceae bacterium]